jgi:wyosine [tRNA(Phe)-imidazoG37] synthetase (radical SAM superfamily)
MTYKYLFGPVPSRRLGRSLGVDLVPMKTCSVNCVFCQLGSCVDTTIERGEYVPTQEVIKELKCWLAEDGAADCITLSGSGEPTLHTGFGEILRFIKLHTKIRTVLLTNSTLFFDEQVRSDAISADIIKVSLSAWDQASFESVNRPAQGILFDRVVEGLVALRAEFAGEIWMEVFLVPGLNTLPEQVKKIAALAAEISPDRIQLNTAVRPPAESFVQPVPERYLHELVGLFEPLAEVIASFKAGESSRMDLTAESLLNLIVRHPATVEQIAQMTGRSVVEVSSALDEMSEKLRWIERDGSRYYQAISD